MENEGGSGKNINNKFTVPLYSIVSIESAHFTNWCLLLYSNFPCALGMSICLIIVNMTHLIVNTNLQIWDRVTARVNWQIFNHIILKLMSRKTLLGTLQGDSRQAYVRMGASVSPSMSEGVVSTQNILSLKIFYWDLADLGQPFKGHSSI